MLRIVLEKQDCEAEKLKKLQKKMLNLLVEQAELLSEINRNKNTEPELIRKNTGLMCTIYLEIESYQKDNSKAGSINSILQRK